MSSKIRTMILVGVIILIVGILAYPRIRGGQLAKAPVDNNGLQSGDLTRINSQIAHATAQPKVALQQAIAAGRPVYLEFYGKF